MHQRHPSKIKNTRGVALVEVLVAILLFALGILALVGLQGALTRSQTDSKIRTDAAALASEVTGQMWGDINNLVKYDGDACEQHPRCNDWLAKVTNTLPNGDASITANSDGDVSVTLTWQTPAGESHQYVTQTNIVKAN